MMAAKPTRRLFTVDEYYRMAKAGILNEDDRVELIEGEIIQLPPIGGPHGSIVIRLNWLFSDRLRGRAVISPQNPFRISARSEPLPDFQLLRPRADFYRRHPEPPDVLLVVEVSDTTLAYDQRVKIPLYARSGVPEVWIVDIRADLVR